jgi:perosamine synthetase
MIPLSVPNISGNEWKYIKECLDTNWVSSVGSYVDKFEEVMAHYTGAKYAVSVVNGTAALHISLLLSDVKQGDYVILPNITFVASANSISYVGAEPILIDIDKKTWQMDLDLLESFLAEKCYIENNQCFLKSDKRAIKAIMPVHVLGNMCDIDKLLKIAQKYCLTIIEDATEALGSFYKNQHAGTFGTFGCFSFNGNKILTTGGGGIIVTNDEALAKKAKHITTQAKSDKFEYVHDEIGYNYRMVNILAAMGVAQMELLESFLKRKMEINHNYKNAFSAINGVQFQEILLDVKPNNWLFTAVFPEAKQLMTHLLQNQIQVRPFWVPMNELVMFKNCLFVQQENISKSVYQNAISLPCSTNLTEKEQQIVIEAVKKYYLV